MTGKQHFKTALPYMAGFALLFLLVPLPTLFDPETAETSLLLTLLFIVNPALSFGLNILYILRNNFYWPLPLLTGGLFALSIPIFYNQSAIVYAFSYIVLAYLGAATGHSIRKDRQKRSKK